jgi:hypothetical protein
VAREAAQERARFAALPSTRLLNGYRFFAHVRFCREARDGYASIYINDVEYERAEKVIKAIVEQTTKEDAAMNTDDVWEQALQSIAGHLQPYRATQDGQRQVCQHSLQQLFNMPPTPVYSIQKP